MTRIFKPLTAAAMLFLVGCGEAQNLGPTGSLSGPVVIGGKPAPAGTAILAKNRATGYSQSAMVDANGTFSFPKLPVGNYGIGIITLAQDVAMSSDPDEAMKQSQDPAFQKKMKETVTVPANYRSPEGSPLTAEVKEGENAYPIAL